MNFFDSDDENEDVEKAGFYEQSPSSSSSYLIPKAFLFKISISASL